MLNTLPQKFKTVPILVIIDLLFNDYIKNLSIFIERAWKIRQYHNNNYFVGNGVSHGSVT